jgi:hypothetical protein
MPTAARTHNRRARRDRIVYEVHVTEVVVYAIGVARRREVHRSTGGF